MVKYCPRCGYPNADDAVFCVRCGYQLPNLPYSQPYQQPPQQPIPYQQPPQYPPYQQPPYGAPPAQLPPYQQPKKKFPVKAVIGAVVAVVVVLVVLLVVLPLLTPHSVTAVASTAQSLFGGSWSVDKNKSGTGVYIGNGEYKVTFLNGSTEIISLSQLNLNGFASFGSSFFSGSGGLYYQPGFVYTPPSKIAVAVAQGNVNGQPTCVIVVGEYWNTSPNLASYLYNLTEQLVSTEGQYLQQIESQASANGATIQIDTSGSLGYFLIYTANQSIIQEAEFQSGISLNYTISQIGIYAQYNSNTFIGVMAINVPMNSVSAGQALAADVQSSL
ncbi:MAG: zinc ribbon domain-containing protein [Sulfolobus sp.]